MQKNFFHAAKSVGEKILQKNTTNKHIVRTLKAGPVFGCAQRMMKFPFLTLNQHKTGRRPCNTMNKLIMSTISKPYAILLTNNNSPDW